jgi:hypothetical protein
MGVLNKATNQVLKLEAAKTANWRISGPEECKGWTPMGIYFSRTNATRLNDPYAGTMRTPALSEESVNRNVIRRTA